MSHNVNPIPEGFHGVTPHIVVKGAAEAITFYQKALGAVEINRMPAPGGDLLMHAEVEIGGSRLMLCDEMPDMQCLGPGTIGGTPVTLHLYVEDVDATMEQVVAAGGKVTMPVDDTFWGDRYGRFDDPFGHSWSLATHKFDPTSEEMQKTMEAMAPECPVD